MEVGDDASLGQVSGADSDGSADSSLSRPALCSDSLARRSKDSAIVSQRKGSEPSGTGKSKPMKTCSRTTEETDSRSEKWARSDATAFSAKRDMLDSKRMANRGDGCVTPGSSV